MMKALTKLFQLVEDTKAAFIDLYEKVDATINAPSEEPLTDDEANLRSAMISDEDNWEDV